MIRISSLRSLVRLPGSWSFHVCGPGLSCTIRQGDLARLRAGGLVDDE
ncbi:hypothetical protein K0T92_13005 [Paenibacillus oenotherae]|uniref:Uncharacterized protein n=1 Tax=Paenibacillus oenotherae TaxID=1435645 RepID=A0ABS7D715_9BACL|nr:hypothetical protein [Paenibacillus oenotherae]MBW7475665.1 hypothetical protein [Paenibacillus oenotherae]